MKNKAIQVENLTKFYGKQKGIENLSFQVEIGDIYGFIGPNGAGKSTTIRTLMALIQPEGGSAMILGKDCIQDATELAKDIGYLPAESGFYEKMKVSELLKYTADLYGKDCKERTAMLTQRLKLDVNRKVADLSYGNKKKVGIVCALLHSPKLVILDEPTSGLDPLIQQIFFDILKEENERGMTILFSSHILSEVQKICNRVGIVKDGKVIQELSIHELVENGYKKVHLISEDKKLAQLASIEEVNDFCVKERMISFLFYGKSNQLIQLLSEMNIDDVLIQEATLEEIFMHYYQ